MRILVTGGAGYIGSHTVVALYAAGHHCVIVDDFSNSSPAVLPRMEALTGASIPCIHADVRDRERLDAAFSEHQPDAVIHFAGLKAVGESVAQPRRYYDTNIGTTLTLIDVMNEHEVKNLVFSSSATVYSPDSALPMDEEQPLGATNPYGWSKFMNEQILRDVAASDESWRIALLRYFNPVGAHPSGTIGEDPRDFPNNLMPFIAQVATGRRDRLSVFGDDYDTPDGTGVRDYLHVDDLAEGHIAALEHLQAHPGIGARAWNLGTGHGTSVLELLQAFRDASGHPVPHQVVARRPGDIAASYADPTRAHAELGWRATRTVADMCADTWRWQSANPHGYSEPR